MAEVKEYVVYMTPIDTILLDWNDTLWKYGYPAFSKNVCREIARGQSEGGPALPILYAELRRMYEQPRTEEEKGTRFNEWMKLKALGLLI